MKKNKCCCSSSGSDNFSRSAKSRKCSNEPTIQKISTMLSAKDIFGACKVRWGIGRMDYKVEPGLYSAGRPDSNSPVLVSANYKLTFDALRKNLDGLDCWLLILDTKGVNVWCAAGKGTFGTDELINRLKVTGISKLVSHRELILPQLGAVGVSAHEVKQRTGFSVIYGPVRASDIKVFIASGYKATKKMRRVDFTLRDRLVLTPMELIPAIQKSLPVLGGLFITNQFAAKSFDKHDTLAYAGSVIAGTVVTPVLLPYIPGKAFAFKGWLVGLGCTAKYLILNKRFKKGEKLKSIGELLLLPAVSSYLAMNFTGSSTYTSPSGVNKEMKKALPWIVGAATIGGVMMLGDHLLNNRR